MKKRRLRKSIINVPVASMGDIAFLLIIFFMLASHFAQERGKITLAKSFDVADMGKEIPNSVLIDKEGKLYWAGKEVDNPEDIETLVRELVKGRTNEVARTIVFKCDRSIGKETFEPVLEAIAKGGGLIAAIGEKEEGDE